MKYDYLIELLLKDPGLIKGNGATVEQIKSAEEKLGCAFADDYRTYLLEFGTAIFDGHEFTGIGGNSRTHVVDVTEEHRQKDPERCQDLYVIEDPGIDGILVWQNSTGEVFTTVYDQNPRKRCQGIVEYLQGVRL